MASTRAGRALTLAHQKQLNRLRDLESQQLTRLWKLVGDVGDDTEFIRLATPVVRSSRLTTARLTTAYLNGYSRFEGKAAVFVGLSPDDITDIATGVRAGAQVEEVLHRPTVRARKRLADGALWVDAMNEGESLLVTIARTDVALVERATMALLNSELKPVGWVRVAESNPCSFCARAAGQRVSNPDINPIHPNCVCTLEPIYRETGQLPVEQPDPPTDDSFEVEPHGEYGVTPVRQPQE